MKYGFLITFIIYSLFSFGRQFEIVKGQPNQFSTYDSIFEVQNWRKVLDQRLVAALGKNWKVRIIKKDSTVPNITIGSKLFGNGENVYMMDYKGKLLIIDFWNTYCRLCISLFPKMQELQKRYSDKIQILLVNVFQSKSEIIRLWPKNIKFPDLPIVVGSDEILAAFPNYTLPHHVWIDSLGVVKGIGASFNTNDEKLQDYFHGRVFNFIRDENLVPVFDDFIPYYKIINREILNSNGWAFMTYFDPNYATISGGSVNLADSNSRQHRLTFVNKTMLELLTFAYSSEMENDNDNIVLSPYLMNVSINITDTAALTNYYIKSANLTDAQFAKSRYCYEQISPFKFPTDGMKDRMKKDLDSFCNSILKVKVTLKNTASVAKVIEGKKENVFLQWVSRQESVIRFGDTLVVNGYRLRKLSNISIADAVRLSVDQKTILKELMGAFLLDETNQEKMEVVYLPEKGNLVEINKLLELQGYTITNKYRSIPVLDISPIDSQIKE